MYKRVGNHQFLILELQAQILSSVFYRDPLALLCRKPGSVGVCDGFMNLPDLEGDTFPRQKLGSAFIQLILHVLVPIMTCGVKNHRTII